MCRVGSGAEAILGDPAASDGASGFIRVHRGGGVRVLFGRQKFFWGGLKLRGAVCDIGGVRGARCLCATPRERKQAMGKPERESEDWCRYGKPHDEERPATVERCERRPWWRDGVTYKRGDEPPASAVEPHHAWWNDASRDDTDAED